MGTQLVLLGNGTPNLEPDRFQAGYAVIVDDVPYIVDCGGGVIQRISQARDNGIIGLDWKNLNRLFLTHLHPDHSAGLADFIIAPWVEGRESLEIYGATGTNRLVNLLLQAYAIGIDEHRNGLAPLNHPMNIGVQEIRAGDIYSDERMTVEAIRVSHGTLEAYAYKFTTADKVIVFSGDTRPEQPLIEAATGCDILVHEVYSAETFANRPPAWQLYHRTVHTSTQELAFIAQQVQPQLLIVTHQLLWGTTPDALIAEITSDYAGEVVYGRDLAVY